MAARVTAGMREWFGPGERVDVPFAAWEVGVVAVAVCVSLALGFANLDAPSLWHDELVHVYVGESITQNLIPQQPSGEFYVNSNSYNYILGLFIFLFGLSETVVRSPSVLITALNVTLVYVVIRRLLGRPTALVALAGFVLSPWTVSWARQARFYSLQQTTYLLALWTAWHAMHGTRWRTALRWTAGAVFSLGLGFATSLHSVLFLGPLGAYAVLLAIQERRLRSRWMVLIALCCCGVAVIILAYYLFLPREDHMALFKHGGLGGKTSLPTEDPVRSDRFFYVHWFRLNLSAGYFLLALAGLIWMPLREGRRGLFATLAFAVPLFALTYLIGYRRPRFAFFAYPFYVAAYSYAMVQLARLAWICRRPWPFPRPISHTLVYGARLLLSFLILAYGMILAKSTVLLAGDSLETASGHHITLARRHPRWREPCRYVRERLADDVSVISTTGLPVYHYVGRVDDWFPSRTVWWETPELHLDGLEGPEDLAEHMESHPKGFFLAEFRRWSGWRLMQDDVAWVEAHMTRVNEGSNEDITVYSWGL